MTTQPREQRPTTTGRPMPARSRARGWTENVPVEVMARWAIRRRVPLDEAELWEAAQRVGTLGTPALCVAPVTGPARDRAHAHVRQSGAFVRSLPTDEEREHLATGVGAMLRSARLAAGLTQGRLALGAGCASSTPSRLERGLRRPRPATLAVLASVLDPEDPDRLTERLCAAAGESLVPDTPAGVRARERRARAARIHRNRLAWRWSVADREASKARFGWGLAVDPHVLNGCDSPDPAVRARAEAHMMALSRVRDQADQLDAVADSLRAELDRFPRQVRRHPRRSVGGR